VDANPAHLHPLVPGAHLDLCIHGTAIQEQRLVLQEGIEVGPWEERWGDLPAREMVDFRLPVLL
jgi:hypothetical protein